MNRYLRRLANASPAKVWTWVSNPRMLAMNLSQPGASSDDEALRGLFPDTSAEERRTLRLELLRNEQFFAAVEGAMVETRGRRVSWSAWGEFLYLAVRIAKPDLFIETGVFDGQSSAILLQAMADNRSGQLISIDYPAVDQIVDSTHRMTETTLPAGKDPGWLIPQSLRERHELHLGDSREVLPELLGRLGTIDAFMHDSLHTFEHMDFEYRAAWPKLRSGGLLLSDDIGWNAAFHGFCQEHQRRYWRLPGGMGATRK